MGFRLRAFPLLKKVGKMYKKLTENKKMFLCITCYFIISVFLRGFLSDFPKKMVVYQDELRYLELARSIFHGKGLMVHNSHIGYQKILYSIVIMPALLFQSPEAQIRAIGWLNSIIMASAIFPAYGLAERILKRRNLIHIVLIVCITLPTFVSTVYFMSEVLFFPISLWIVYMVYMIIQEDSFKSRVRLNIGLGILFYAAYVNKEIALYYLLAYLAVRLGYMVLYPKVRKEECICLVSMLIAFLLFFIVMKLTFFYGMGNSYNQMGLEAILSVPRLIYLIYGFVYDLLFAVLAMGVFTVIIPIASIHKQQDDRQRQYLLFVLCSLLIGCIAIAYTITVREDFPKRSPRQHLRYLEPLIIPFFIGMLSVISTQRHKIKNSLLKRTGGLIILYGIAFVSCIFSIGSGPCVDHSVLKYFEYILRFLKPHALMELNIEWQMLLVRELLFFIWLFIFWLFRNYQKHFVVMMILSIVGLNLVNNKLAYNTAISVYGITDDTRKEMAETSNILNGLKGNILLISDYSSGDGPRLFDTYIDHPCLYRTNLESLITKGFLNDGVVDLQKEHTSDIIVVNSELDQVHWIVAPRNILLQEGSVQEVNNFPLANYRLYQNMDIEKIYVESMFPLEPQLNQISAKDHVFFSDSDNEQYLSQKSNQRIVYNPATFVSKGLYKIVINYQYLNENKDNQGQAIGRLELGNQIGGDLVQELLVSGNSQIVIDQLDIQDDLWRGEFRIFAYDKGVKFENCIIERIN